MKGYRAVAEALRSHGVQACFAVPGDGNILIDYELSNGDDVRYVKAVREDGAVMMAHGYAQVTGRLGVASVTFGPGLTNTLTALTTAVRSRTPLLVLTGDLSASAVSDHVQALDMPRLLRSVEVAVRRVDSAVRIQFEVDEAVRTALRDRQPTVLLVPLDVQRADVEVGSGAPVPPGLISDTLSLPAADALEEAAAVLAAARRPVILAGRGAGLADAREPLLALAERMGAPVCTTLLNKGFFASDPYDLGIMGTVATEVADEAIRASDCVLAFGASLNHYTTAKQSLTEGKALVQCDSDRAAIGRHARVTAGLVGDASSTAARLHVLLDVLDAPAASGRTRHLRQALEDAEADVLPDVSRAAGTVGMQAFLRKLNELIPAERSVAVDGGRFFIAPVRALQVPDPSAFVWTLGFGSIGLGLAAGIGAAVGAPHRPVIAVLGDGGFMMGLSELSTAVRYDLDIVVVVLNDGCYGAEYAKLSDEGLDPAMSLFDWPDLGRVATSFGCPALVVTDLDASWESVVQAVARRAGPLLIEVRCDPRQP